MKCVEQQLDSTNGARHMALKPTKPNATYHTNSAINYSPVYQVHTTDSARVL